MNISYNYLTHNIDREEHLPQDKQEFYVHIVYFEQIEAPSNMTTHHQMYYF